MSRKLFNTPVKRAAFWATLITSMPFLLVVILMNFPEYSIYFSALVIFYIIYNLLVTEFEISDRRKKNRLDE